MSPDNKAALAGVREMKIAFDVTEANPQALLLKLETIELTRKQLIEAGVTPVIVVAFRGNASFYTQPDLAKVKEADRADALKIRAKLRELSEGTRHRGRWSNATPARLAQDQARRRNAGSEGGRQRLDLARRLPAAGLQLHRPLKINGVRLQFHICD